MLKKLLDNMYIIAAAVFFLFSCAYYVTLSDVKGVVGGVTIAVLCLVFQYLFKVKWSEESRKSLLAASEELKNFGKCLPLSIIGKLSMAWIVLLVLTLFKPFVTSLIPSFPSILFTVISNLCFALFILSTFYQILSGNLKGLSFATELFAIYNIVDVIITFAFDGNVLSIRAMCLFLAFWSIHVIFGTMLSETDPALAVDTPKKEKKSKKKGKDEAPAEASTEATSTEETPVEEKTE